MIDPQDSAVIKKWFGIGDILTAIAMIAAIAMSHGSLLEKLDTTQQSLAQMHAELEELKGRDITPGARSELARLSAQNSSQDEAIQEIRESLREQRREILDSLERLEAKLESRR